MFEPQGGPSSGPHEKSGAVEEFESEGAGRLQRPSGGALQGAITLRESGFDLEVGQEVVGDQDELLPGTVGLIVLRGDGVEGQVALEFSYGWSSPVFVDGLRFGIQAGFLDLLSKFMGDRYPREECRLWVL